MYPSGRWDGFWVQSHCGRQAMSAFALRFADAVRLVKQYIGKHQVLYVGQPDGEGSIAGTWYLVGDSGPFLMRPVVAKPSGDEPIQEIG